jgi:hypothetical protein
VGEKYGCATANQKRNKERHERFSSGKPARYLLREWSQISSRMNCMVAVPRLSETRIGAVLFQDRFAGLRKWFRSRDHLWQALYDPVVASDPR